ncbi:MAG: CBS domain-containing protein [Sterolibacterium sp.]|nr:CBS domain-containing protein [Sterolibacterium sp.]
MRPISNILKARTSSTVYATAPEATVFEALRVMADKNLGALLVMRGKEIVGIFSERDYARKIALFDLSSRDTPVSKIMSSPVISVSSSQSSHECMAIMTRNRLRHLPVLDDGELVGIVSIGDLVKDIIAELEFSNDQLVDYIHGGHGTLAAEAQQLA